MNLNPFRRRPPEDEDRSGQLSLQDYVDLVTQWGLGFGTVPQTFVGAKQELIGTQFRALAGLACKQDPVVFACMAVRMRVFAQARFQWRRFQNGRPQPLFGDPSLAIFETPWQGGTTGDLLARMIQHADLGGNAFVARRPDQLVCLRPDWVTILIGSRRGNASAWDVDAEVAGYLYEEGGPGAGVEPEIFLPDEVAHFAPLPDPDARFRGMSWVTPIVREIMADKAATDHKLAFFENGATPNLVVKLDVKDLAVFEQWIEKFEKKHEGVKNAYKTMWLGAGADATVVGLDLKQLDFKIVQGAGETRIAAAAGVPPVIVGLSEGLEAATYSNYGQARRAFADVTLRHLWQEAAAALNQIVTPPDGAHLWYDDRDIAFLAADQQDAADVRAQDAATIRQYIDAGFEPESAVAAVASGDLTQLVHSGLVSVQLQPPGSEIPQPGATPVPPPALISAKTGRRRELVAARTRRE